MPSSSHPDLSVKFFSHKDLPGLQTACEVWEAHIPKDRAELPAIGYVCSLKGMYDGNDCPIAYGFLRVAEGNIGILEGLTTWRFAHKSWRHLAIDAVVNKLLDHAHSIGLTQVIAWTRDAGTLSRSKSHGFLELPDTLIAIDLRQRLTKD